MMLTLICCIWNSKPTIYNKAPFLIWGAPPPNYGTQELHGHIVHTLIYLTIILNPIGNKISLSYTTQNKNEIKVGKLWHPFHKRA